MLDPQMEQSLFAEARRDMITGAAGGAVPSWRRPSPTVLERGGEFGLDALLGEIVAQARRSARASSSSCAAIGAVPPCSRSLASSRRNAPKRSPPRFGRCRGSTEPFSRLRAVPPRRPAHERPRRISCRTPRARFAEPDPVQRLALLAAGFPHRRRRALQPARSFKKALSQPRSPTCSSAIAAAPRSSRPPTAWRCSACWKARVPR